MGRLQQHPDGFVIVQDGVHVYNDTVINFARDFGVKLPALPVGADDRVYDQGVRHAIMGGGNVIGGGPMQWDWGDAVIAALPTVVADKYEREAALKASAKAARDTAAAPVKARRALLSSSPDAADLVQRLKTATPTQIDNWVDGNVTNLADARNVLKAIVKILATQL